MPPPYASYAALAAEQTEGVDYTRTSVTPSGAAWASIAIHGGGIEGGSGEMAEEVAGSIMAFYEFAGIKASGNSDLHITSTLFDEPNAVALVGASVRTLSFHGFTGTAGVKETAVGGLDTALGAIISARLASAGFNVGAAPSEISGSDPTNICNENLSLAGVQLELSNAQRAAFFTGGDTGAASRAGPRTDEFYAYAAAVAGAYNGAGLMSLGSVNVSRWATLAHPSSSPDQRIAASVATDAVAVGGSQFAAVAVRFADTSNCYLARLAFETTGVVTLTLRKRVAGVETLLATAPANGLTHAADARFWLTLDVTGTVLSAKTWLDNGSAVEPSAWQVTIADTDLASGASVGVRGILSTANTNTLPVIMTTDHVTIDGRQQLIVERGYNGMAIAHAAGTAVHVKYPIILAR